ncbi:hypothetical protein BAUCODRAFT_243721 [Baudoinia panamericana UAMH 10762]|uniref:AB hydrolase-1 domain-containing protein n=1 Tax=Baudoinia panamericana (strain UAMH 10762) TaxID=717646 RepID=M2N3E9_BAUPA|nr:uncharacterized protein BAUCODRAFT_243721 [Baudoinia panamericana UAMH 10762]EMC93494.1 hypothetical protein BAUCODRAFT_243721 [Baudoinia panamericana UAMH 10762]
MIHYISCPPSDPAKSKGTILLIHGFPQTSYQFRRVITPISDAGYHVVVPDYRGAGESSKPWTGYTKDIMARDLYRLVTDHLSIKDPIHVVGHDIGGMVAHAYAVLFPDSTASVCWGECPLPGSQPYHEVKSTMPFFHFTFHCVPDLPELLVQGKERIYLKHFYDRHGQNPSAISTHDLDVYATAYAMPGSMRGGMNTYRAFEADGEMNNKWVKEKGKCKVRCLNLWGAQSFSDEKTAMTMAEPYYEEVGFEMVTGAGHWIAEERPAEFVEKVLKWVESK